MHGHIEKLMTEQGINQGFLGPSLPLPTVLHRLCVDISYLVKLCPLTCIEIMENPTFYQEIRVKFIHLDGPHSVPRPYV